MLKIKQEASGWPDWVGRDETKRQQYIREYHKRDSIMLEYEKIEKDPGLRALAKMMLNSMWGKFSQRPNKTQVKEFVDPIEFHKFLDSVKYDVGYVGVINDSRVEVHYQHEVEDNPVSPNLEGPLKYLLRPLLEKNQFAVTQRTYSCIGPNLDNIY